jgi:hypothetical protein
LSKEARSVTLYIKKKASATISKKQISVKVWDSG